MQDRFQFRVWDKYTHGTPAEQMQFLCFNGCLVDSDGCHHSPDDYIVEQCTGLKDKNGNLIYEGDVLFDGYCKRIVKWGGWFWIAESKSAICPLDEFTLRESEIIGNIHQPREKIQCD